MICWCCSWVSRSILSRLSATNTMAKAIWVVCSCDNGTPSFHNNKHRNQVPSGDNNPGARTVGRWCFPRVQFADCQEFVDVGDVGEKHPRGAKTPVRLYLTIFHRDECFPSKKATSRHIGLWLQLSPREGFGLNTICLPFAH